MFKTLKFLTAIFFIAMFCGFQVFAADITPINDLIEKAKEFDGKTVTVQGEAIGEVLPRGIYSWVNIHDGTNAIGIWIKSTETQKITHMGDYKHKGDTVMLTGVFRRACAEHGGESDIHSDSFKVTQIGSDVTHPISASKIIVMLALVVMLAFLSFVAFRLKILKFL